jgi:hypothetical protein
MAMTKKKLVVKRPDGASVKPRYPTRYAVLNDDIDHLAIEEIYPKLMGSLQVDLKRVGEGRLRDLIAETPEFVRLAGYIYAVASDDYERAKDEYEAKMGIWATEARAQIATLKKEKRWEGGAYSADVERWVAAHIPEHETSKATVRYHRKLRDAARRLFEAYEIRLSSLQSYAKLIQKRMGLSVAQRHGKSERD